MHGNSGYEDEARPLAERFAARVRDAEAVVSPSASCAGFVREHVRRGWACRSPAPPVYELSEFLVDELGGRGRRRVVPAPRDAAPDLPLDARAAASATGRSGCCARCAGSSSSSSTRRASAAASAGRSRSRTRTRRWRCWPTSCAHVLDTARRGLHGGGHVVPDAHRRRARAPARRRARRCTSPRSSRPRNERAASRPPRSDALADAQLRRNLGKATTDDPREARRGRSASCPTGRSCATRAPRSRRARWRRSRRSSSGWRSAVTAAGGTVHWARDGAEANAIVAGIARAHGARRGDQGQVARHGRDRAQRGARAARDRGDRDRPGRADRPARRRRAVAHPRPRDPPQPGGDRGAVRAHHRARGRSWGSSRRAIAEAARTHLREKFLSVPVAISGANFAIAETGAVGVVESEGNGRMCTTLPKVLVTRDGDREGAAGVARPRGDAAAAAALLDRRAHEPVHVGLDRRARGRRPAGVPPRAARRRPHARCSPTRSAARRCTASAAPRA